MQQFLILAMSAAFFVYKTWTKEELEILNGVLDPAKSRVSKISTSHWRYLILWIWRFILWLHLWLLHKTILDWLGLLQWLQWYFVMDPLWSHQNWKKSLQSHSWRRWLQQCKFKNSKTKIYFKATWCATSNWFTNCFVHVSHFFIIFIEI